MVAFLVILLWMIGKIQDASSVLEGLIWSLILFIPYSALITYAYVQKQKSSEFVRPARWKVILSSVGLIVFILSWIPDYDKIGVPYHQTPKREDLHIISGDLVLYDNYYGIDIGERKISLRCPVTSRSSGGRLGRRGSGAGSGQWVCFPKNIESYLGSVVEVHLLNPLEKEEYKYDFYELKSGNDILVSYDVIASKRVVAFKRTTETIVEDTVYRGFFTSTYVLFPILLWIFGVFWKWRRSKKFPSQGEGASSRSEGAAL